MNKKFLKQSDQKQPVNLIPQTLDLQIDAPKQEKPPIKDFLKKNGQTQQSNKKINEQAYKKQEQIRQEQIDQHRKQILKDHETLNELYKLHEGSSPNTYNTSKTKKQYQLSEKIPLLKEAIPGRSRSRPNRQDYIIQEKRRLSQERPQYIVFNHNDRNQYSLREPLQADQESYQDDKSSSNFNQSHLNTQTPTTNVSKKMNVAKLLKENKLPSNQQSPQQGLQQSLENLQVQGQSHIQSERKDSPKNETKDSIKSSKTIKEKVFNTRAPKKVKPKENKIVVKQQQFPMGIDQIESQYSGVEQSEYKEKEQVKEIIQKMDEIQQKRNSLASLEDFSNQKQQIEEHVQDLLQEDDLYQKKGNQGEEYLEGTNQLSNITEEIQQENIQDQSPLGIKNQNQEQFEKYDGKSQQQSQSHLRISTQEKIRDKNEDNHQHQTPPGSKNLPRQQKNKPEKPLLNPPPPKKAAKKTSKMEKPFIINTQLTYLQSNEQVKDLTESNVEGYVLDDEQSQMSGSWTSFNINKYMKQKDENLEGGNQQEKGDNSIGSIKEEIEQD